MDTVFRGEKVQTQVSGTFAGVTGLLSGLNGMEYTGYEIHMGRSQEVLPVLNGGGTGDQLCAAHVLCLTGEAGGVPDAGGSGRIPTG